MCVRVRVRLFPAMPRLPASMEACVAANLIPPPTPPPLQGVSMDMDEVECVAANLIFRRYVKGYISHKSKVMVVAKAEPFPPLSTAALNDA